MFPSHDRGTLCWLFVIAYYITDIIQKFIEKKYREVYTKEKKPNILIEYIKAKKEKYCPRIEFE